MESIGDAVLHIASCHEASRLHIVLLREIGEAIPTKLVEVCSGGKHDDSAAQNLYDKIVECGGTNRLAYIMESNLHNIEIAELWAWWLRYEWNVKLSQFEFTTGRIPTVDRRGNPIKRGAK